VTAFVASWVPWPLRSQQEGGRAVPRWTVAASRAGQSAGGWQTWCSRFRALLRRPGPCGLQLRKERPGGDPERAAADPDARQLATLDQPVDRLRIQLEQFGHLRRRQEGASAYVRSLHKQILYVISAIHSPRSNWNPPLTTLSYDSRPVAYAPSNGTRKRAAGFDAHYLMRGDDDRPHERD
jgi:hypothetical protein